MTWNFRIESMSSVVLGEYLSTPRMKPETVKGELSRLPMYVIRLVVMNPDCFSSIMESTLFLCITSRWLWLAYDTRTWIWLANEGWRNRRLTVQFESICELKTRGILFHPEERQALRQHPSFVRYQFGTADRICFLPLNCLHIIGERKAH